MYSSAQTNTVYYKATGKTTIAGFQSACSGDTCTSNLTSNPLTISSTDMNLQPLSPAIDAGTSAATSTDYAGNPIYGTPDIGAYEYQPPYTFASNNIPTTGSTRLYSDGKYRMVTATSSASTGVFSVKPSSGSYLATTTQYMDITINSWLTTELKQTVDRFNRRIVSDSSHLNALYNRRPPPLELLHLQSRLHRFINSYHQQQPMHRWRLSL